MIYSLLQVAKENAPAAEHGSAQVWGSKKTNMNHLLNFHFESRDYRDNYCPEFRGGHYGDGRRGVRRAAGCSLPYNKERFLQAKYVCWRCLKHLVVLSSIVVPYALHNTYYTFREKLANFDKFPYIM